jgi:hypothetical protein
VVVGAAKLGDAGVLEVIGVGGAATPARGHRRGWSGDAGVLEVTGEGGAARRTKRRNPPSRRVRGRGGEGEGRGRLPDH